MDKQIRDKFLIKAMGECWHEFDENSPERHENWDGCATQYSGQWNDCTKCGEDHIEEVANNAGFDTWAGFGKLWEWSQKQEWWMRFISAEDKTYSPIQEVVLHDFVGRIIVPCKFADAIYLYLAK